MNKICLAASCLLSMLLTGCAAVQLNPNAQKVMVSPNIAPKGCKYVGQVVGNQGNFFTGGWTSNKNLEEGAMNDLRNSAARLNANYVQLLTNRSGVTGGQNGGQQTNVTNLGNAYACPAGVLN